MWSFVPEVGVGAESWIGWWIDSWNSFLEFWFGFHTVLGQLFGWAGCKQVGGWG